MDCFKKTDNDWCPSFDSSEGPLVHISTGKMDTEEGEPDIWHVSGSGDDDLLIQRFYENENKAICDFMHLLGLEFVNMSDFDTLTGTEEIGEKIERPEL